MIRIVAYQTEIAQNLGNMIRTAACLGVPISVVEPCGFPFSLKALRRSAMYYADLAEISHHLDWNAFRDEISGRRVLITTKSTQSIYDFEFAVGDQLIFGKESAGVPESVRETCDEAITIPMPGGGRSLNLASATAITASEALRQLGQSTRSNG